MREPLRSKSGSKRRGSRIAGKSGNAYQLWLVRQVVQFKIQPQPVAYRVAKGPHEMCRIPWRQVGMMRACRHRAGIRRRAVRQRRRMAVARVGIGYRKHERYMQAGLQLQWTANRWVQE